jgi:hypothetical protein
MAPPEINDLEAQNSKKFKKLKLASTKKSISRRPATVEPRGEQCRIKDTGRKRQA